MDTFEIIVLIVAIAVVVWVYAIKQPQEAMRYKAKKQVQTCNLIMEEIKPTLNKLLLPAPAYFRDFATEFLQDMILKDENIQVATIFSLGGIQTNDTERSITTVALQLLAVYNKFIELYPSKKNEFTNFLQNIRKETKMDKIVSTIVPKEYLPDNF